MDFSRRMVDEWQKRWWYLTHHTSSLSVRKLIRIGLGMKERPTGTHPSEECRFEKNGAHIFIYPLGIEKDNKNFIAYQWQWHILEYIFIKRKVQKRDFKPFKNHPSWNRIKTKAREKFIISFFHECNLTEEKQFSII